MFKFLEASSTPDTDNDCGAVPTVDVKADTTAAASYLKVSISTAMLIQRTRLCTLANASGLMGRNYLTWTLRRMNNMDWYNHHHILLQL